MTIRAQNRTPAALASQLPQPAPIVYTQDQLRERRRAGLLHRYGGDFDLAAEVTAICEPLVERVAASPRPVAARRDVDDLADAVHELVSVAVGLIAERDARRKTAHLSYDTRGRSIRALVDLAERPKLPEIDAAVVVNGQWVAQLVALAEPYSEQLSDVLRTAVPPGATRGARSASERLETALRRVDAAAAALDRNEKMRASHSRNRASAAPSPTDRARAELAALGIDI